MTIYFGPRDTMSYYSFQQASRLEYYTDFEPRFFNSEDEKLYKSYMPKGELPDILLFTTYQNRPISIKKATKGIDIETSKPIVQFHEKFQD